MCTEFKHDKDKAKIKKREKEEVYGCVPHGDIRPTDYGDVIIDEPEDRWSCQAMRWGWRVPWDKSPLVNAKSETLLELPTFKPHLQNRCVILCDGFYERGVLFHHAGHESFALAGLWRQEQDGPRFTMLTTTPCASVAPYHHRMPFILRGEDCERWLGKDWLKVLESPDKRELEKFEKQPGLF